jgi:hypothetical protein
MNSTIKYFEVLSKDEKIINNSNNTNIKSSFSTKSSKSVSSSSLGNSHSYDKASPISIKLLFKDLVNSDENAR